MSSTDTKIAGAMAQTIRLHEFESLRYVDIRVDWLAEYTQTNDDGITWDPATRQNIAHALPPCLEELRLNASDLMHYLNTCEVDYKCFVQDMLAWLLEIVIAKPTAFPALRSVGYTPRLYFSEEEGYCSPQLDVVEEAYVVTDVKLFDYETD